MTDKQRKYIERLIEELIESSSEGTGEFVLSSLNTLNINLAGLYGRIELTNDEYMAARKDVAAQVNEWVDGGAEIPEMNTQLASAVIDQLKRNGLANGWAAMHQYAPQVVRDAKGR